MIKTRKAILPEIGKTYYFDNGSGYIFHVVDSVNGSFARGIYINPANEGYGKNIPLILTTCPNLRMATVEEESHLLSCSKAHKYVKYVPQNYIVNDFQIF